MQHYRSFDAVGLEQTWLTIGSFDGIHRGHQAILKSLADGAHAAGRTAVVLTFFPHPSVVIRNREGPIYLTSSDERARLIGELQVDVVITLPFTRELSNLTAREFMALVARHLSPSRLLVGEDFALGRSREGNVSRLLELSSEFNYRLEIISPVKIDGETISSSQIRAALAGGQIALANKLLGRPYTVSGRVIHGDGRGRFLGIPTANLQTWTAQVMPKSGVYVCQALVNGQSWSAVTNIGTRPTFDQHTTVPTVEAHLLDFDLDLYGQEMELRFIQRLRDEQRFPSLEALVAQIQADIDQARRLQ